MNIDVDTSSFDPDNLTKVDDIFEGTSHFRCQELHFKHDHITGLRAIIAIHNTKLGPALGGCRCIEYPSTDAAIIDAMRLARGMSYKAAISGVAHGGGKAVIIKPKYEFDRAALFEAFGRFVDELGGRYITAKDSGTDLTDMDFAAKSTRFVATTTANNGVDPSPSTALGVLQSIKAAVKHKLGRDDLEGLHISIQGLGAVGYNLAKYLYEHGAKLTVADINPNNIENFCKHFDAKTVGPEEIFDVECDIFAPCALGATLNDNTISRLQTKIIAGCANNQLARRRHGDILRDKGVLYAPDFLVNAGGLIHAVAHYDNLSSEQASASIHNIYDACLEIFERADKEDVATSAIAEKIARERLFQ